MELSRESVVLRSLRLLLAVWLLFAPVALGYWGTFVQKQDIVAGLILVPLMLAGLFLGGMRAFLFAVGAWLVLSPEFSGMYFAEHTAMWNDRICGLLAMLLSLAPWSLSVRERVYVANEEVPVEHAPVGFFARMRRHRRITLRA